MGIAVSHWFEGELTPPIQFFVSKRMSASATEWLSQCPQFLMLYGGGVGFSNWAERDPISNTLTQAARVRMLEPPLHFLVRQDVLGTMVACLRG